MKITKEASAITNRLGFQKMKCLYLIPVFASVAKYVALSFVCGILSVLVNLSQVRQFSRHGMLH